MTPAVAPRSDGSLLRLVHRASEDHVWLSLGLIGALLLHLAAGFGAGVLSHPPARAIAVDSPLELTQIELPHSPPPAAPEPAPAEKAPAPKSLTRAAKAAPPPAAAQAAAVLTRAPDQNEPVDLTAGFIAGSAATYAGGQSSAAGLSSSAVHTQPAIAGVVGGTGQPNTPTAPSGPDLSRRPEVTGVAEWRCPFPAEADTEQIDHAVVTLRVDVDRLGHAIGVVTTKDPGHGFAREARLCALRQQWSPALDRGGAAVRGSTTVNVRFNR